MSADLIHLAMNFSEVDPPVEGAELLGWIEISPGIWRPSDAALKAGARYRQQTAQELRAKLLAFYNDLIAKESSNADLID